MKNIIQMEYFLLLLVLLTCSSCIKEQQDPRPENCTEPYNLRYSGHALKVPVSIRPHQIRYEVGDTIRIGTHFLDSVYDLSAQKYFELYGFPFRPVSVLYRVDLIEWNHEYGYAVNGLTIDSMYGHTYLPSNLDIHGFTGRNDYDGETYRFEAELVLRKAGRYVLEFRDEYVYYVGSFEDPEQELIDSIAYNSGLCPTHYPLFVWNVIDSGNDYLDSFKRELSYIDEEVYSGRLGNINTRNFLEPGNIPVERNGFFAFEVVE